MTGAITRAGSARDLQDLKTSLAALKKNITRARLIFNSRRADHGRDGFPEQEPAASTPASSQGSIQQALRLQERQDLLLLLLLSALQQLELSGNLHKLYGISSGAPSPPASLLHLPAGDVFELLQVLFESVQASLPADLQEIFTPPTTADKTLLKNLQSELSQARASFACLDESCLGYIYQLFSAPIRADSQKLLQTANKSSSLRQMVAFTQLYTPRWVVDFLLHNALLPLWRGSNQIGGEEHFPYLIGSPSACGQKEGVVNERQPASQLTVLDPACGSGHFLLRAFDLLLSLYRQEDYGPEQAAKEILENNIYGVDLDPVGLWVTALSLLSRSLAYLPAVPRLKLNLAHCQERQDGVPLMGSLHRSWSADHLLMHKYRVVVTNPPYLGRKLLDRQIKSRLKTEYTDAHQDLCAAFLSRSVELLKPGGRLGMIIQASLLYLPTYGKLRQLILESLSLKVVVEAGTQVFPLLSGEKVNSALIVVEKGCPAAAGQEAIFFDLTAVRDKERQLNCLIAARQGRQPPEAKSSAGVYLRQQSSFAGMRKHAFNYRCPPAFLSISRQSFCLSDQAEVRQGLATTDNRRFVRLFWEVDPAAIGSRWFPYVKGAGSRRWWAPIENVVNFEDGGRAIKEAVNQAYPYLNGKTEWVVKNEQFYFREGLSFSFVSAKQLSVRYLPPGCIFDVAGSAVFSKEGQLDFLLAYLNSSFSAAAAGLLNPTINFQVGDLKRLPLLRFTKQEQEELSRLGRRCLQLTRRLCRFADNDWGGTMPEEVRQILGGGDPDRLWRQSLDSLERDTASLALCELEIDRLVLQAAAVCLKLPCQEPTELEVLCRRLSSERKPPVVPLSERKEFALAVLAHHLNDLAQDLIILPSTDEQDESVIHDYLGLKPSTVNWLSSCVNMDLFAYFVRKFNEEQCLRYQGSPRNICLPLPDGSGTILLSCTALRAGVLEPGTAKASDAVLVPKFPPRPVLLASARALVSKLQAELAQSPDWTGAQLMSYLRNFS